MSPPIRFLIYPTTGVLREHVRADLFGRVLSQRIGRPLVVELARTYEAVVQELAAGRVHLAWATSEQCDAFEPQARAVLRAVRAGRWHYHSALICRASSPMTLERLRGARAAWVDPLSTGGYLLPRRYLESQGLQLPGLFSEEQFHGSYRKALLAVSSGQADIAPQYSTHPDEPTIRAHMADRIGAAERGLKCFAVTGPTLADGLVLTSRLEEQDAQALISVLTGMTQEGSGMEPLLGLFNIEGFALVQGPQPPRATPLLSQPARHFALQLDAQGSCQYLWSSSGEQVLPEEVGSRARLLARAVQLSGVGGETELHLERDGKSHVYSVQASPRLPAAGQPSEGTCLLVRDVTASSTLEGELYRLASFPVSHPDPMLELGLGGTLRYANPAAHAAFPDLQAEGPSHPLVQTALARVRQARPSEAPALMHLSGHDWELTVTALQDNENLRVFARDVTARKQLEASLMRADRLSSVGSLASRVGQEMNEPLSRVRSHLIQAREGTRQLLELLRTGEPELARAQCQQLLESLGVAMEGSERLKGVIQALHLLTREPPRHKARVNVHSVLEDALRLLRAELQEHTGLEKELHPVPPIDADEARLGQVFLNLMLSALQAMEGQPVALNVLRVSTFSRPEGQVVIELQHSGPAVAPEVLEHLFDPFSPILSSAAGMGLSASHAITTSLGGSLSARSRPEGGLVFTLTFPSAL